MTLSTKPLVCCAAVLVLSQAVFVCGQPPAPRDTGVLRDIRSHIRTTLDLRAGQNVTDDGQLAKRLRLNLEAIYSRTFAMFGSNFSVVLWRQDMPIVGLTVPGQKHGLATNDPMCNNIMEGSPPNECLSKGGSLWFAVEDAQPLLCGLVIFIPAHEIAFPAHIMQEYQNNMVKEMQACARIYAAHLFPYSCCKFRDPPRSALYADLTVLAECIQKGMNGRVVEIPFMQVSYPRVTLVVPAEGYVLTSPAGRLLVPYTQLKFVSFKCRQCFRYLKVVVFPPALT